MVQLVSFSTGTATVSGWCDLERPSCSCQCSMNDRMTGHITDAVQPLQSCWLIPAVTPWLLSGWSFSLMLHGDLQPAMTTSFAVKLLEHLLIVFHVSLSWLGHALQQSNKNC